MISRLFGKKACNPRNVEAVDLSKIDHSFNLLKTTATEVAIEAANAAHVLQQEQRRTKACFTALNSASDIIFIMDNEEKLFFVNDQFVEKFNLSTYDDAIGKELPAVLPDIEDYKAMWKKIRKNEAWKSPFRSSHELSVMPMMNGKPEPIYYICTLKPVANKR